MYSKDRLLQLVDTAHSASENDGWWDMKSADERSIELTLWAISEICELWKSTDEPDKHLPQYTNMQVEMADIFILGLDYLGGFGDPIENGSERLVVLMAGHTAEAQCLMATGAIIGADEKRRGSAIISVAMAFATLYGVDLESVALNKIKYNSDRKR